MKLKTNISFKYKPLILKRDNDAVSNIVTSIMMLGIFLSILAMIFTIYIPIWAKNGEANHMQSVESSFLDLKSTIDLHITDDEGVGSSRNTRIRLGSEGGAIMGIGRTSGSLEFKTSDFTIIISNTDDPYNIYGSASGKITFKSQNVYYNNQYFMYENGAVIVEQDKKSAMRAEPHFNINYDELTNKTSIDTTIIQLSGDYENIGGTEHRSIETKLVQSIGQSSVMEWTPAKGFDFGQNITINITTEFGEVWEEFLNDKLNELPEGIKTSQTSYTKTPVTDPITNKTIYTLILNLKEIDALDLKKGIIEISLN